MARYLLVHTWQPCFSGTTGLYTGSFSSLYNVASFDVVRLKIRVVQIDTCEERLPLIVRSTVLPILRWSVLALRLLRLVCLMCVSPGLILYRWHTGHDALEAIIYKNHSMEWILWHSVNVKPAPADRSVQSRPSTRSILPSNDSGIYIYPRVEFASELGMIFTTISIQPISSTRPRYFGFRFLFDISGIHPWAEQGWIASFRTRTSIDMARKNCQGLWSDLHARLDGYDPDLRSYSVGTISSSILFDIGCNSGSNSINLL